MIYGWIWIALIVICAALAVLTRKNIFVSLSIGALPSLVMDVFSADLIFQIITFVAISLVALIVIGKRPGKRSGDGIDSIVGMRCVVVERIDSEAGCGQVMVNGQSWSARAVDETVTYEEGETLKVLAIEGVKLICVK
jgi:membrane protein implicated in regulation of membrane protease activity